MSQFLILLLIAIIPLQFYFNFYKNLSISLAQILGIGLVFFSFLKIPKNTNKLKNPFVPIVFSIILILTISLFTSLDKINSIKHIIKWSFFISLFIIPILHISDIKSLKTFLKVLIFTQMFIALIGLIQYIIGYESLLDWMRTSLLPKIIMEPDTLQEKLRLNNFNWVHWSSDGKHLLRVFSTFECSVVLSAYFGLTIPFIFWMLKSQKNFVYLYIFAFILIIITLFLTFSRSAYISLFISCIIMYYLLKIDFRKQIQKIYIYYLIILLIIITPIFLFKPVGKTLMKRTDINISEIDRLRYWNESIKIFEKRPFLGVGLGNYNQGLKNYIGKDNSGMPAHNQFLEFAAETGILGLITLIWLVVSGIKYSYKIFIESSDDDLRYISIGFLGIWIWYAIQSIFNTYLFDNKFSMIFWLMVGINASLYNIYNEKIKYEHQK